MKPKKCPCGSNEPYRICCGRFHNGKLQAGTAEVLMRSRFSAYVLNIHQYIYRTWDTTTRPPLSILRKESPQIFTQLEIINTTLGGLNDDTGTVEFVANYMIINDDLEDKTIHQHHENSYFVKTANKWKYVNEVSKIYNIQS